MTEATPILGLLLGLMACVISFLLYPPVLRFARKKNIVDNPDARKLQREPVPVLGGLVVFVSFALTMPVAYVLFGTKKLVVGFIAVMMMTVIGIWDDLKNLPAAFRFVVEIVMVWLLMQFGGFYINDLHGLWGVNEISFWWAAPLSIFAGVGLINAINLIDGVDGYSSGYGIGASLVFATALFRVQAYAAAACLLILAGALLPFFLHNLFGKKSKMFIGDGGTLLLGTAMTIAVFYFLHSGSPCAALEQDGVGLVAFTLAVLAVPVFDTLRVMTLRMARGNSPFNPDKTHLHHLFIEMGFSHVATAGSILALNTLVVLIWWLSWKLGASVTWQFYIVVLMGLLITFVFYKFVRIQQARDSRVYAWLCGIGDRSHRFLLPAWVFVRKLVDSFVLTRFYVRVRSFFK